MSTAHKTAAEVQEHFDAPDVLARKVDRLVALLRVSKHAVAYTGAGISTSAGIPDFRGPTGVWTLRAQGKTAKRSKDKASPTPCHMALVRMVEEGVLAHVVSQNCDGLHRRSGLRPSDLSELHGNTNIERCRDCGREYFREFRCRSARKVHDHATGRRCTCGGMLHDSIINFGENLPEDTLARATEESERADLALVLGTSLRVTPAADLPEMVPDHGGALCIVNLQHTPLDALCTVRIYARTDEVMRMVMERLALPIAPFTITRALRVHTRKGSRGITVVEHDTTPDTRWVHSLECVDTHARGKATSERGNATGRYTIRAPVKSGDVRLCVHSQGYFRELPVELDVPGVATDAEWAFALTYHPKEGVWDVQRTGVSADATASALSGALATTTITARQ